MKLMTLKLIISVLITLFISIPALAYSLPKNIETPILVYHSFSSRMPTENSTALLTLYANGRIIAGSPSGLEKTVESSLTPQQLQQLLQQIIDEHHFFNIDTQAIQQQISSSQEQEKGKLVNLMDANAVSIQLQMQDSQKMQHFYGLSAAAKQYPAIKALADLAAIEIQLQKVRHWLLIGKDEGLSKELALANQKLQQQYPDVSALTESDLEMASLHINGERNIHFQRQQHDKNNKITGYVSVYNQYDNKGKVTVVVTVHQN